MEKIHLDMGIPRLRATLATDDHVIAADDDVHIATLGVALFKLRPLRFQPVIHMVGAALPEMMRAAQHQEDQQDDGEKTHERTAQDPNGTQQPDQDQHRQQEDQNDQNQRRQRQQQSAEPDTDPEQGRDHPDQSGDDSADEMQHERIFVTASLVVKEALR